MDFTALNRRIADSFPRLSPQPRRAARHVLDRPDDVALMSMRRQAASAGVLVVLMVAQGGEQALSSIEESEDPLARFDACRRHRPGKRGGAPDNGADR